MPWSLRSVGPEGGGWAGEMGQGQAKRLWLFGGSSPLSVLPLFLEAQMFCLAHDHGE